MDGPLNLLTVDTAWHPFIINGGHHDNHYKPGARATLPGLPGAGMTVGLFITCINDVMFPQTGVAVTTLLERLAAKLSSHGNRPVAPR